MQVDEMEAGRELDALVAEKVMGWRRVSDGQFYFWPSKEMVEALRMSHPDLLAVDYFAAPEFSADIAAAWKVVEKMYSDGWTVSVGSLAAKPRGWRCTVSHMHADDFYRHPESYEANADTAPLAICRAVLKAVGVEEVSP